MRSFVTTFALLIAACAAAGCATGLQGLGVLASIRHGGGEQPAFSEFAAQEASYSPPTENAAVEGPAEAEDPSAGEPVEPTDGFVAVSDSGVSWSDSGAPTDDQAPPLPEPAETDAFDPAGDPAESSTEQPAAELPDLSQTEAKLVDEPSVESEPAFPAVEEAATSPVSDEPVPPVEAVQDAAGPALPINSSAESEPQVDAATGYPVTVDQNHTQRQEEVITTPRPDAADAFKPHTDEADTDRFSRRLTDIPLDIRPTEGIMPGDPGAAKLAETALADPRQFHQVPGIGLSCTPWTICFRPLYFEEVALERYGDRAPCCLQPAVSGVRFFSNVALLPYKMRVRPPRSFVCSNGFSRVGDCPLPGYGECVWRWDAVAVEMAAVTGFVFILP